MFSINPGKHYYEGILRTLGVEQDISEEPNIEEIREEVLRLFEHPDSKSHCIHELNQIYSAVNTYFSDQEKYYFHLMQYFSGLFQSLDTNNAAKFRIENNFELHDIVVKLRDFIFWFQKISKITKGIRFNNMENSDIIKKIIQLLTALRELHEKTAKEGEVLGGAIEHFDKIIKKMERIRESLINTEKRLQSLERDT